MNVYIVKVYFTCRAGTEIYCVITIYNCVCEKYIMWNDTLNDYVVMNKSL